MNVKLINKKMIGKFRRIEWIIVILIVFNAQNLFAGWGHEQYGPGNIGFDHQSIDSACSAHYYAWGWGEASECIYQYDSGKTYSYLISYDQPYQYLNRTSCIWNIYSNGRCTASQETTSAKVYLTGCPAGKVLEPETLSCVPAPKTAGCGKAMEANPCDAATGNKFQSETDYQSNTLQFARHYNSLFHADTGLGNNWTHNFSAHLTIGETVTVHRSSGKAFTFTNTGGSWTSDADITDTLTQVGSDWYYKPGNDQVEVYNAAGQLVSITTRDGKQTILGYTDGKLTTITGPFNRQLQLSYDAVGRISSFTTPDSTTIAYGYDDASNNLISVTYPDDTPGDLTNNPKKTYHYEKEYAPYHLTGITDENNIRYATWDYDGDGKAILSEHANAADNVTLDYINDTSTVVTDALGRVKTYTFENHLGVKKPQSIQYDYHDGKQPVTKTKTYTYYPETGRIKNITDYNGNTTYYEYNARGLVTVETRAKGTPEQYSVTTSWHPDYRLPLKQVYPDREIDYLYDNQGQLVSRTEKPLVN